MNKKITLFNVQYLNYLHCRNAGWAVSERYVHNFHSMYTHLQGDSVHRVCYRLYFTLCGFLIYHLDSVGLHLSDTVHPGLR